MPTTWDEYVEAAAKLHKADPKAYITNDTGDAGFTTSMIWQAGGTPFKVDGTNVDDRLRRRGRHEVRRHLAAAHRREAARARSARWSDEWYKGLGDGTIATLATGAWMPANLDSGVPNAAGNWRVAPHAAVDKRRQRPAPRTAAARWPCPQPAQNKALAYALRSSTPTPATACRPASTRAPSRPPRRT